MKPQSNTHINGTIVIDYQDTSPALDRSVSLRRQVTAQAMQVFAGWSYREIQIPLLEYFDSLKVGLDETQISRSFRFVDRAGNLMVLRPDITPAIAKVYAYQLQGIALPLRVSYANKVIRMERSLAGSQLENYQLGIELIGSRGIGADIEVILVALELMNRLDLRNFQVNIADHEIAGHLLAATGAPERIRQEVENAIIARDEDDVRAILRGLGTRQKFVDAIASLAGLEANLSKLDLVEQCLPNDQKLKQRIAYLREVERTLTALGYGRHIRVDLAELDGPGYYTGLGFSIISEGAGREVARGGRYDKLIGMYGAPTPAIGFSFSLEALIEVLHPKVNTIPPQPARGDAVYVTDFDPVEGLKQAVERRSQNLPARLVHRQGRERDET